MDEKFSDIAVAIYSTSSSEEGCDLPLSMAPTFILKPNDFERQKNLSVVKEQHLRFK
jgi:hypothetical protein